MKFTLEIELGNDAMQTYGEVLDAAIASTPGYESGIEILPNECGTIRDINGNTVGKWEVTA